MNKCTKCGKEYREDFKFCPECGGRIENPSGMNLFKSIGNNYKNTYGTWKVTTEGDEEGRSTRDLGTYIGHIDDIALHLADKCFYSLCFHKVEDIDKIKLTDKTTQVNIMLDIDSKTWDMNAKDRAETMKELFKDRNIEIKQSNFYASFVIKRL